MESQNENGVEIQESGKKENRAEKTTPDYPLIKVQLPREAALKVQVALQTLKERKADTKCDELLADFLNGLTDDYLEGQIEKRTPEDYYFEAARNIPELKEKIIQQARKALQRTDKSAPAIAFVAEAKRGKKKEKIEERLEEKLEEFQESSNPSDLSDLSH